MIEAKVIERSRGPAGSATLTTMQLRYPRFIHSAFMTHRVFSRNATSSRAVPFGKTIDQVIKDPAMPIHWGQNQPGMQAREEIEAKTEAEATWRKAAGFAAYYAQCLAGLGLHKQVVNRILEPFLYISVIVSSTEWDNFFALRRHPDAQPEMQALAEAMAKAFHRFPPIERPYAPKHADGWHLPYVTPEERQAYPDSPEFLAKLSAARCARISYLTHDGAEPSHEKDLALFHRLATAQPMHASPMEHQAFVGVPQAGNFRGWVQFRHLLEAGEIEP